MTKGEEGGEQGCGLSMAGLPGEQEGAGCDENDADGASRGGDFPQNDKGGKDEKDGGECKHWYAEGKIGGGKCPVKEDCCHSIDDHGCSYRWNETRAKGRDAGKEDQRKEDQGSGKEGIPGKEKRGDPSEEHLYGEAVCGLADSTQQSEGEPEHDHGVLSVCAIRMRLNF